MNFERLDCLATAAFGLEGLVAAELKRLGMQQVQAGQGGARFTATAAEVFWCNLRLRFADRVLLVLAEGECRSFEDLYQYAAAIPWEQLLTRDANIHVSGQCARSQLMSVRDCQSVCKRAILDRLTRARGQTRFPESGARFPIDVALHGDRLRLTLDTSGEALNRRGYRTWNGEAPLRETLAAALVELSGWRPGQPLQDPCCGTGTLPIEAAFRAGHRAPGLTRAFACEDFPFFPAADLRRLRAQAEADVALDRIVGIGGSDKDPAALELARRHVQQAGLNGCIDLSCQPLEELQRPEAAGVFLCNPPYGERLGDRQTSQAVAKALGQLQRRHPGWRLCAISSDPMFERSFGRRADKRRRLYNGRLECEFLVFGER